MAGRRNSSVVLTALVASAYALTYVFYVILARNLPLPVFGVAGAYLAVLGLLSLVSSALIFAAARLVGEAPSPQRAAAVRRSYLPKLRLMALLLGASGLAAFLFRLEIGFLLLTVALVPLRDVHCGLLNGLGMNGKFGAVVFGESVIRIAGALATSVYPFAWIAIACWFFSYVAGWAAATLLLPASARAPAEAVTVREVTSHAISLRIPQVSLLNADVILVGVLFGASTLTGLYVAAALLSRIPFYLLTPYTMGELPRLVQQRARGPVALHVVWVSAAGAALLAAPLMALPNLALTLGFGPSFAGGAEVLSVLAGTGILLVLANTFAFLLFARGHGARSAAVLVAGAGAEIGLIMAVGSYAALVTIAWMTFGCATATVVGLFLFFMARNGELGIPPNIES